MEGNVMQPEVAQEFQETSGLESSTSLIDHIPHPSIESALAMSETVASDFIDISGTVSEPVIAFENSTNVPSANEATASLSSSESSIQESTCRPESAEKSSEQVSLPNEVNKVQSAAGQKFQETFPNSTMPNDHQNSVLLEPESEMLEILAMGDIDVSNIANDNILNSISSIGDASALRERLSPSLPQNATKGTMDPQQPRRKSTKVNQEQNRKQNENNQAPALLEKARKVPQCPGEKSSVDSTPAMFPDQQQKWNVATAMKEEDIKGSSLQTNVASNTEGKGNKQKKRKRRRNRRGKKSKISIPQTAAAVQNKESPASDSAESTCREPADAAEDAAKSKPTLKEKQAESIEDVKQGPPQNAVKEQIQSTESSLQDNESIKKKSKKRRRNRKGKKSKISIPQTAVAIQNKESSASDSAESTCGEQADAASETAEAAAKSKSISEGKQSESSEDVKQIDPQNTVKEQIPSTESTLGDDEYIKSKSKKKRAKTQDEKKDSRKKSKLQQNTDLVEDVPVPAVTEKEVEVGSASQISNTDSKDPKESGKVKPQSGMDGKAAAAGTSHSGQDKSAEDTAKPKSAKDQSTSSNTGRGDSVQVNHKATQQKDESETNDDNKNVPESNSTHQSRNLSNAQKQRATCCNQPSPGMLNIYFYAIIPNEVKFNQRCDKLLLVLGGGRSILECISFRNISKAGKLVQHFITLPLGIKGNAIPYQYAVQQRNEWIQEMASRFLNIPNINENEWHQYDGIMNFPPSRDFMNTMRNIWSPRMTPAERIFQSKRTGGQVMLQTIFNLLESLNNEGFEQIKLRLKHFQMCQQMTFELEMYTNTQTDFDEKEVNKLIIEQVKKFLLPYTKPEPKDAKDSKRIVKNPFVAGMVAFVIRNHCSLVLDASDLITICHMLQMPQTCTEEHLQHLKEFAMFFPKHQYTCTALINYCISQEVLEFVQVVPLLHWCTEQHQPPVSSDTSSSKLEPLQRVQYESFRYRIRDKSEIRRKLLELMFQMKPMIEKDPKLVLTWFSLIATDDIPEYSKEMGMTLKHVAQELMDRLQESKTKMRNSNFKLCNQDFQAFGKIISFIKEMVDHQSERENISEFPENCLKWGIKVHTIICELTENTRLYEVPTLSFQFVMKFAEKTKKRLREQSQADPSPEANLVHVQEIVDCCQNTLRSWRTTTLPKNILTKTKFTYSKEPEMWCCHFSLECGFADWTTEWRDMTKTDLIKRLEQETPCDQIVIYWNEKETLTALNPTLLDCFECCALNAVKEVCQSKKEAELLEKLQVLKHQKCPNVLSEIIEESGKRMESSKFRGVGCVLSSDCAVHYCLLQGDCSQLDVSEKARGLLKDAEKSFRMVVEYLWQGCITVADLQLLLQKRKEYFNLFKAQQKLPDHQSKAFFQVDAEKLMSRREDELEIFQNERKSFGTLINMIDKIHETISVTDISPLEEKHKANIQSMRFDELIETKPWTAEEIESQAICNVKYFVLSSAVKDMAMTMHQLKDSMVLQKCWLRATSVLTYKESTLEDLCTGIWSCCWTDYKGLCSKTDKGTITFQEIDWMFSDQREKSDEIRNELAIMFKMVKESDLPDKKLEQIQQYFQLHSAIDSARVLQDIVRELNLQGDFRKIQNLTKVTEHSFKKQSLEYIDRDLIETKKLLVKITPECRECLQEFIQKQPFVNWVKDALTNLREVKVFVDLASISAGENDMEIDRVACFHDAVMGYSPLIYELQQNTDFEELKTAVYKIQKALKSDPKLSQKLRDSARYLEWLITLRESHGSVETSSLSLATAINHKGVYVVGSILEPLDEKLSLERVLHLALYDESTDEWKMYTLKELKELQNKLMLMSGKRECGKEEVARFMENFNNVQRLGKAFIELYSSGNMLYRNWRARVHCSKESDVCMTMDFKVKDIGPLNVCGDLSEQLPLLCRALEKCLQEWHQFIEKSRAKYYHLNYYTAEQVVYLCSGLGGFAAGKPLCEQLVTMLSFIKPDCTVNDIRRAMPRLIDLSETFEDEESDDFELETEESESEEVGMDSIEIDLPTASSLQYITERVYAPTPTHDHHEEHDNELTESQYTEPSEFQHTEPARFQQIESSEFVCEEIPDADVLKTAFEKEEANLSEAITLLWNKFMENMATFLINHLDIFAFGELLGCLSRMNEATISRQLPPSLRHGRPNLIVCAQPEIFKAALCLYMQTQGQPLPTYDEVLLCSEETTNEEVELFLRRALSEGSHEQKIYTVIHADCLSYETGVRFGELFEELLCQCKPDYQFVAICDTKRQHCYVPSYLSHYKVPAGLNIKTEAIQQYLEQHFTVPLGQISAANVFLDRLSVRVVSSKRPGVGKSLYIERLNEKLLQRSVRKCSALKRIRLIEPTVDENRIVQMLHASSDPYDLRQPMIFHIDVSPVRKRLEEFLFKILILGFLKDSRGRIWKRSMTHLYIVEHLDVNEFLYKQSAQQASVGLLGILPTIHCRPPREVRQLELKKRQGTHLNILDPLMDEDIFVSEAYQRPYQYLHRFSVHKDIDAFSYQKYSVEGNPAGCLTLLLQYCGLRDPSWAELRNFSWFLNLQLKNCEQSVFCKPLFVGDTLIGFKNFIIEFMILMAQDFATPAMNISDESPAFSPFQAEEDLLPFLIRKRWENNPHPYIFFNADHLSMTFLGFHLRSVGKRVDAVDHRTGEVLKGSVMSPQLVNGLSMQRIRFNEDIDNLPREEKIRKLCLVLGVEKAIDPDETYELTADNMMKMLAIHMRFRCEIPVIIMGETGCGKTRLIRFLCDLQKGKHKTETLKLVKVHGGTTAEMIYAKIGEAEKLARVNNAKYGLETVLFFDEANTTEAIHAIKEVLCDKTVQGKAMKSNTGLKIIAACNPYRRHSETMIKRLEMAGLGYRVKVEETEDKLGKIPLRQLVYRVQPLPPSMIPLVWDFGQLSDKAELAYTNQIVRRYIRNHKLPFLHAEIIMQVLAASQTFMRQKKDECSFVSLRDVERCMKVLVWFYEHRESLFDYPSPNTNMLQALMSVLGVCYYPSLSCKAEYLETICKFFPEPYNSVSKIHDQIVHCQNVFMKNINTRETIAKNEALNENVFLMVICIELRIPLFLVGKPGSSKSLAKTVVLDAMQGQSAHCELFKKLKQVHMVSFQCSPHSTADGIINTFKQCARFQQGKNLDEYVSVVVLDEIGLAEDSPQMPLKTLHPLLEDGCIDDDNPVPHKKVGFIGISNWALDPAKMNRGIFVSRLDPCEDELIETAKGICSSDPALLQKVRHLFPTFAKAYLEVCKNEDGQFFGLRDYYSLVKMVFITAKETKSDPTEQQLADTIFRNFSGKDDFNPLEIFLPNLESLPQISTLEMVKKNIRADSSDGECRYLLLLTKNYVALQIVLQHVFLNLDDKPEIIFGSSFPKDQEYTQICRNVNRVKTCMETGRTVILLNLKNLYESLYDALNQYYVNLGEYQYVDLGLGTHRVKCRVDRQFRLIVIEDRDVVYEQFPIPLVNRLEKHSLDMSTVLNQQQKSINRQLELWVKEFVSVKMSHDGQQYGLMLNPSEVIIGFHTDACASVLLQVLDTADLTNSDIFEDPRIILKSAKKLLLNCVTPDAVVRLKHSKLADQEVKEQWEEYFVQQCHRSLSNYIHHHLGNTETRRHNFVEVTTFSRLLTKTDVKVLVKELGNNVEEFFLLFLHQFDTEYSFCKKIRESFQNMNTGTRVLLIQMDTEESSQSSELIASAKYCTMNEMNLMSPTSKSNCFVYFITKLSRIAGRTKYIGFQGGQWLSVHIDDMTESEEMTSDLSAFYNTTISGLFVKALGAPTEFDEQNTDREGDGKVKAKPSILNTTFLLQSCTQSAVSKIRDGDDGSSRNTDRVQVLLDLLREEGECEAQFLRTVAERLTLQLQEQEEISLNPKEWMCNEAKKISALQEGGTFRHTLWKCIQKMVTPNLALMISILDRDYNLNLLVDRKVNKEIKQLWLNIFKDTQILRVSHQQRSSGPKTEEITVSHKMNKVCEGISCAAPFSWLIKEYIDHFWVEFHYLEGTADRDRAKMMKFVDSFNESKLGQYLGCQSEDAKSDLGQRYLTDFILMTINVSSSAEVEVFKIAFVSCMNELHNDCDLTLQEQSPPWIHIAYNVFKNRLHNLSKTISLYPIILEHIYCYLQGTVSSKPQQMMLDIFTISACAEKAQAVNIVGLKSCKELVEIMETVQPSVELIHDKSYIKACGPLCQQIIGEIRSNWECALVLGVFIEHVVFSIPDTEAKLQDIAVKYCARLQKILRISSDLKKERTLEGVIEVLQLCNEEASHLDYRYGIKECAVCLGVLNDPACLPCEHVFCFKCLDQSLKIRSFCPKCKAGVPGSFKIEVSIQLKKASEKYNNFRQRCNLFFMEVVSRFCFSEDSPPSDEVITLLLSLLIAVRKLPEGNLYQTRSLTPFSECVDINPVIRSILLKLMLHYSFDKVKVFMQNYLSSLEENLFSEDLQELYLLFIKCFEDSINRHFEQCGGLGNLELFKQNCNFLSRFARHKVATCNENAAEYLQNIARLRFCFNLTAQLLYESHNSTDVRNKDIKTNFMDHIKMICLHSGNDWYQVYLMRTVYDHYGMAFVQSLQRLKDFHWMFPDKIIEKQLNWTDVQMDCFIFCGREYKTIRDTVAQAILKWQMDTVTNQLKTSKCSLNNQRVYLALAFFREVTSLFAVEDSSLQPSPKLITMLQTFIKDSKLFEAADLKDFCTKLVENATGDQNSSRWITARQSNQRHILIEIIVHAALVFICGENVLKSPLYKIAFRSAEMRHAYLPTMPEDVFSEVKQLTREKVTWYHCSCGEPVQVANCGKPTQTARCSHCGSVVGGQHHSAVPGFTVSQHHIDQTKTGHVLGSASRRSQVVVPDRQMTPVVFLLLRTLTHVSMMLGTFHHRQIMQEMIKPQVPNVSEFLWQHLETDLTQLGKSLGKNNDDTATCIHLVIHKLMNHIKVHKKGWNEQLSSKTERNAWENQFIEVVISPLLQNLDETLLHVGKQISSDERIGGSPVVKMLFGDPSDFITSDDVLNCSSAWKYDRRVCVENFTRVVEQKGGKKATPILWKFLQKANYIKMLKNLPDLLGLQYELIRTFQSASDMKSKTISQFLQQMAPEQQGQKQSFEKRIKIFLQLWNQLCLLLAKNNPKIPQELCQKDLTFESPIEILLPQPQGPGLCAIELNKFLIEIQNDLLGAMSDIKKSFVNPEEVSDSQLIHCDPDKDFIPLVLSNCQYFLEKGHETLPEFDIKNIERQLIRVFLKGKPFIVDSKIPKFVGRHERDYSSIFTELKAKISQETLSHSVCNTITMVLKSYSDICDALDIIEIVVGFLATSGGSPDSRLLCYLKDTLRMDWRVLACVSKAFEGCKLKHTLSLWQLLSSWKSEVMLGTEKDPFERIPDAYKKHLLPQEKAELKTFFASTNINTFLWELHEILVLKTTQSNVDDNFSSEWSLNETIFSYLESKGSDILPGLEDNLSGEITLAKSVQTWKLAVNFKKGIR
ncbi:E3 ubiquitin-protein ligase rnf213-alpha-like isoform X1 [Chiloscyllium plagiosum]|uniref:E3 ubiquitin-protein ligase rnf213-alpha-like isoform X1 n=1 Tax=Chiloscyllium plagiosum TaxID=36176 RepID=UPI001CB84047|nr:E3 ubiquitin-protein ligase rnf213-alpha-like isoform X1 [Chiloscyllium plagiosum]